MTQTRLEPGDPAPEFSLPTADGSTLSLHDLRGRKVVLYAYPAAMTPGCTTQACDFRDSLSSLSKAGIEVVGIRCKSLCDRGDRDAQQNEKSQSVHDAPAGHGGGQQNKGDQETCDSNCLCGICSHNVSPPGLN